MMGGTFGSIYGYIAGWRVDSSNAVVSQLQHLKIALRNQQVTGTGSTQTWSADLEFEEQGRGIPTALTQDSNVVTVDVEVIGLGAGGGLSLVEWSQGNSSSTGKLQQP
jgi:hypothetical protein